MNYRTALLLLLPSIAHAGPYTGAAGTMGSEAIARTDSRFVSWAVGHSNVTYGADVDNSWRTPAKAYGPAGTSTTDIVCLGNGGKITLYFPHPIRDGQGADFAVFENGFGDTFLELGFTEVSSDGTNFFRFSTDSLTPSKVGGFGAVDPTNIRGFAGKYRVGFGTPFDLAHLPDSPLLDKQNVRFVRIVDIIGDGNTKDSADRPIYDPTPTVGSGGFDLDAIGVIHQNDGDFQMVRSGVSGANFEIGWASNPGREYRVERSPDLGEWFPVDTVDADGDSGSTFFTIPKPADAQYFWRVVRVGS